ncbi:MAG: glycosyltransferase family 2 protein, partial [Proteobacteria bacterium]|nr:glycosyltransferase family 2 protein [Pseudomonadota bacterium]MBU1611113.1 glycosyltransferase family 2 protein [Pseudomonadota bacterium]
MHDTSTTANISASVFVRAARALRPHAPTWALGIEQHASIRALTKGSAVLAVTTPAVGPLAQGLARWAFLRRPLDPALTGHLAGLEDAHLPSRNLAAAMNGRLDAPEEAEAMNELLDAGEAAMTARHLLSRLHQPDQALGWLALGWDRLLRMGNADLPRSLLEATALGDDLAPLVARLRAEWAALYLDPADALPQVEQLDPDLFGPWRDYLLAELALRCGDTERATAGLTELWKTMAWHPQLTLKLHALLHPTLTTTSDFSDVAVLLYSWNKAELLSATLQAVAASDLRQARVFVLDNGSTDHMTEVIGQAKQLFPEGHFHSLTLPVNLGAPAARNWLLSLPEVRASRWAAFLDDDVELPGHWLVQLVSEAERAELEGNPVDVVGCRVTSARRPHTVQSADYHLLPPNDSVKTFVDFAEKIMVFDNASNDFDLGLFGYCRPATSVSGCCHLLSLAGVERCGTFDIRFSPTQFDDLERDIRLGVAGLNVHYAGNLTIRHIQHSSLAKAQSLQAVAHVFGNKIKLEGKYTMDEIRALSGRMLNRMNEDLSRKEDDLLAT